MRVNGTNGLKMDNIKGYSKWDRPSVLSMVMVLEPGIRLEQHDVTLLRQDAIGRLGRVNHGGNMTEPVLQIEKRVDALENEQESTMRRIAREEIVSLCESVLRRTSSTDQLSSIFREALSEFAEPIAFGLIDPHESDNA